MLHDTPILSLILITVTRFGEVYKLWSFALTCQAIDFNPEIWVSPCFHVHARLQKVSGQMGKMNHEGVTWRQLWSSCRAGLHVVWCGRHISSYIHVWRQGLVNLAFPVAYRPFIQFSTGSLLTIVRICLCIRTLLETSSISGELFWNF